MHDSFEPYKRASKHIGPIVFRHVFVLVNAIIFSVAVLLYAFSDTQAAVFLGFILFINTLIGIVQDLQAMVALERLQLLTASRVLRLNKDGTEESVLPEKLERGDQIRVSRGDQIPCDGEVITSRNLEVSDALITGESDTFPKDVKDEVLAGGIVTTGSADILVSTSFSESRISQMSENIKEYRATQSPIQRSVSKIIAYSSILLIVIIAFVVVRAMLVGDSAIDVVRQVGALASTIVPQGLIVVTTLLFAFGAASYSRRQVLFQEINAAEKLGRIKNLCMDKTGTLTDNKLIVAEMRMKDGWSGEEVKRYTAAYIHGSKDSSETMAAVHEYVGEWNKEDTIVEALPFSSWRRYGVVHIKNNEQDLRLLVGAPDILLPYIPSEIEKRWIGETLEGLKGSGKRVLCVAEVHGDTLPRTLEDTTLSPISLFVFESGLREGIQDTIAFFQDRGVKIRILSGDNAETVRAVALLAGIDNADTVITGSEMSEWTEADYFEKANEYRIFARVLPEQKVRIIEALERDGFTAMVGDGANDALAIRKADLGIAMFDGAQATRQLAAVVLMNNSFTALPGAVKLADSFIQHLEIFSSIFLNQSILGLLFFVFISLFNQAFPFTPLNITPINYFAVGMPGILIGYWALRSGSKAPPASIGGFMRSVLFFPFVSSVVEAIGIGILYILTLDTMGNPASSTLFGLSFIVLGLIFFVFAPTVYRKEMTQREWFEMFSLFVIELVLMGIAYQSTFLRKLFEIQAFPSHSQLLSAGVVVLVVALAQYGIAVWFRREKGTLPVV